MNQKILKRRFLVLFLAAVLLSGNTVSYAQEIVENPQSAQSEAPNFEASGPAIELPPNDANPTPHSTEMQITTPSDKETQIAPERSFYVKGVFKGKLPDNAALSVSIIDSAGNILRDISSDIKQNSSLNPNLPTYCTDPSSLASSGMPDLIWDGTTQDSLHDGDSKCWFDDNGFTALIPGGRTDGSAAIDDQMELKDSAGHPYLPLPEGDYTIRAAVTLEDGTLFSRRVPRPHA